MGLTQNALVRGCAAPVTTVAMAGLQMLLV
jgi:hypothetical protein